MERAKTLLLVEDDEDDIELAIRALKKVNFKHRIVVVRDGFEAINYLFCKGPYSDRDISDRPSVILLDIKLPNLSGLEVLKILREDRRTKFLPIVMMTSSCQERDMVASYERGANGYTRKPVDFNEFLDTVRKLGSYWLNVNEIPGGI